MAASGPGTPALLVLAEGTGRDGLLAALAVGREYCRESGARLELFGARAALEWAHEVDLDGRHEADARDAGANLWLALGQSLALGRSPLLLRAGHPGVKLAQLRRLGESLRGCDGAFLVDARGVCAALALARAMPELFAQLDWDAPVMAELRKRARRRGWRLGELALEAADARAARP
jgi:hypothetical protein